MKNLINNIKASQAALVLFAEKQITSSVNVVNFNQFSILQEYEKRYSELSVLHTNLAKHTSYLDNLDSFIQKQLYEKYGLDFLSRCILVINYNQDVLDQTSDFVGIVKKAAEKLTKEKNIRVIDVNSNFEEQIISEYLNVQLVISQSTIEEVYGLIEAEDMKKRYPKFHVVAHYMRTNVELLQETIQQYFTE